MTSFAGSSGETFNVLIAGGGLAALEAARALREFGGDRISTTTIASTSEFVYRPMSVREPFGWASAERYPLADIAQDIGVELRPDRFKRLDATGQVVHTEAGHELRYDALVLALGVMHPRFKHAITVDDGRLDELMHGLVQDVEGDDVRRLAFVVPGRMGWPLPIYELALMTAARAYDMNIDLSIPIVTPEATPLAIFGLGASDAIGQLLEENGILTVASAHCAVPGPGRVEISPGARQLHVDRIVAMPELFGPRQPSIREGIPWKYNTGLPSGLPYSHQASYRPSRGVWIRSNATAVPLTPPTFCTAERM